MRRFAGPLFERRQIAPVLPHADVQGEQAIEQILVQQKAIRLGVDGFPDPRPKGKHGAKPAPGVRPHAEIDHNKIGEF
jgi:hypothetical protein